MSRKPGPGFALSSEPGSRVYARTSSSLSGLRAAVHAGPGVAAHARGPIPDGLVEITASCRLPELANVEFVVMGA